MFTTLAGNHDVTVLRSDPGVLPRTEVPVTAIAGTSAKLAGESSSVSFGDSTRESDVLASTLILALGGRTRGEIVQTLDTLVGDGHREMGGWGVPGPVRIRTEVS